MSSIKDGSEGTCTPSFEQRGLWLAQALDPASTAYNEVVTWRLHGELELSLLVDAINCVITRHSTLRSRFVNLGGELRVRIVDECDCVPEYQDFSHCQWQECSQRIAELIASERAKPFSLAMEPLVRLKLVRLAEGDHLLLRTTHHIVCDGISNRIFEDEFLANYAALRAGKAVPSDGLLFQYSNYASSQTLPAASLRLADSMAYWTQQLCGCPSGIGCLGDWKRQAASRQPAASHSSELTDDLTTSIQEVSRRYRVTLFTVMLAAFQVILSRWTGETDLAVRIPVSTRGRPELQRLIGLLVNTVVVRSDLSGEPTFAELLGRIKRTCIEAYKHSDAPFHSIVQRVSASSGANRDSLFPFMFNNWNRLNLSTSIDLGNLTATDVEDTDKVGPSSSKCDITLYAAHNRPIRLNLVYNSDLFERDRMKEFMDQYAQLLRQIADAPHDSIGSYSLLTSTAAKVLPKLDMTQCAARTLSVLDLFVKQAKKAPAAIAIAGSLRSWTYAETDAISSELAIWLCDEFGSGAVIALYARRNATLLHGIVGALKAKAVFVVIDREHPLKTLLDALKCIQPLAILNLTDETLPAEFVDAIEGVGFCVPVTFTSTRLGGGSGVLNAYRRRDEVPKTQRIAYISLTSGSEGSIKAVAASLEPMNHFCGWYVDRFQLTNLDRFSVLSGLGHDPLLRETLVPLSIGATVCIPEGDQRSGEQIAAWVRREGVTVMHLTPTLSRGFEAQRLERVRLISFGGEPLLARDVARMRVVTPNACLVNCYGATETPQVAAAWVVEGDDQTLTLREQLPIGRGIDDVALRVSRDGTRQAGIGEIGEICVATRFLALGYLNDEELTSRRFVPDIGGEPGARMYRSGDWGRYDSTGAVEYLGRRDRLTKVRGHLVSLKAVEDAMLGEPDIQDALVTSRVEEPDGLVLVAYLMAGSGRLRASTLRRDLLKRLPPFMVPKYVIAVDSWPVTRNGKIDLAALPLTNGTTESEFTTHVAEHERVLCSLISAVLGTEQVRPEDNFFELGGDSLSAMRLLNSISTALNVDLPMRTLFESGDLRAIAEIIDSRKGMAVHPSCSVGPHEQS